MIRELDAKEATLFSGMLKTIRKRSTRNHLRKNLYDAKSRLDRIGFSVPPHMIDFQTPLGWAEKAVSVPAARIQREGFRLPGESSLLGDLSEIFDSGYASRLEYGAIKSSLKHGPAFMFSTPGDTDKGDPRVVIAAKSALEATCIQDPRTGVVTSALEMVGLREALMYVQGAVLEMTNVNGVWMVAKDIEQSHDLVLCEPFVWDWDLDRTFGRSRISRPLIGSIERGVRTLLRGEVTAEFFSSPQRALLGADESHFTDEAGNKIDLWKAITGGVWALPDVYDEDEGKLVRAQLQQLQQASMTPHFEMFKSIALQVASETSLPMSYLGVQENQPAAEGAIKAAEADMIALISHQIDMSYKTASVNLARKALAVMHGGLTDAMSTELAGLTVRYTDPGTPTISARSDAALKYTQTFPNGDPKIAMEMYGLTDEQIQRNMSYMATQSAGSLLARLNLGAGATVEPGTEASPTVGEDANAIKAKFDALGIAVRAGVDPNDAAKRLGLDGIKMTGATPVSLRLKEVDAAGLEDR
ncbi:phage portal protein [Arthrobacter glacialis]|uniref:phage portal protein n=1 Tax=Arthrobacter glacialis TaxID=1664 RepID=UPI000CD3E8A1|nr:phage portal protein [Arthrobacter glacialis]POH58275.1 hypothetical protein CVS28_12595 [Arthrobacter glacialis]